MPKYLNSRMCGWLLISVALLCGAFLAGQLIPLGLPAWVQVSLYKLSLVTSAGYVGYWIDRSLFPYGRPHEFIRWCASPGAPGVGLSITREQALAFAAAQLRRALLISAAMIAAAMGG